MEGVNNVAEIPCKLEGNFFACWLTFLSPIHKLTPGVVAVAAELLRHRYILSKSISNDAILDKYLLTNSEVREEIMKTCNISLSNYHVCLGKLKKGKFFIDGRINSKFIPKIVEGSDKYALLLLFNLQDVEKGSLQ